MVVGMLITYFCGGMVSAVVIACSAAAFICLAILKKKAALNAAGFLAGSIVMLCFVRLSAAPVLKYTGTAIETEFVVDEVVGTAYGSQHIIADLEIDGVKTKARLFLDSFTQEGQIVFARIDFRESDKEWELYNLANGILLSGEAEVISTGEVLEKYKHLQFLGKVREYLAEIVAEYIPGDTGALALSLMFGMDELLPEYLSEALCVGGAFHYTAVSGSHFSVFAAIILSLIPSRNPKLKAMVSLLFAPVAVLFFGFSNSLLRAAVMFGIYGLQGFFLRQTQILNTLCLAVIIICMASPAAVLDIGFGMSVLGVLGTGVVGVTASEKLEDNYKRTHETNKIPITLRLIKPLLISICAVICTAPLTVMAFGGVSLTGAFTTVILMPLIGIGMMLVLLLGATGFGFAAVPLGVLMKLICLIIELFGSSDVVWLPMNYQWASVACIVIAINVFMCVMAPLGFFECSAACTAAMMVLSLSLALFMQNVKSDIVIVGNKHSSAQIIIRRNEAVVVASGTGRGLSEILPRELRKTGVRKITDLCMMDADYNGAVMMKDLSEKYDVERISTNNFSFGVYRQIS